ncbi:site-specific integrase [Bosea beijingensis]|uniref:site-specific integrase n=1 Tax=Bosea beijingensis TaxID=3068632 RepID=UPI00274110C3|nr:site-specific integrase [Bosea sp. REN20]
MRYDEIRSVVRDHFHRFLNRDIESIAATGPMVGLDRASRENAAAAPELSIDDDTVRSFIEKYDLQIHGGSNQFQLLRQELIAGYQSYARASLKHNETLLSYDFGPKPEVAVNQPADAQFTMTLSELGKAYEADKKRAGQWVAKTEFEKADHLALLTEILGGDADVARLSPQDAKRVKDTLHKYPKNRSKNPKTRGKALDAALAVADVPRLSVKTINKYIQTYGDMFGWALRNGYVKANLFSGLTIRQSRRNEVGKRESFSADEVNLIVNAICAPDTRAERKPYQKWGPLIGIYSGARLNEIAQVHLKDIRQEGGIWCFDLNEDDEGKSLKAAASKRLVPIHSRLIELGLLQYVDELRGKGKQKLFQDFRYCSKNGWGRNLGRWFNDTLLPRLELKRKELVFHSLRHTVVTQLLRADVPEPIVKALVGHAQEGVTQQNYFQKGYTVPQLKEAMERLKFSVG